MNNDKFFEEQTDSSRIKASIVAKYFPSYCRILNRYPQKEFRYLDLFAGPGMYKDGNFSTPLLLGESITKDKTLRKKVRFLFNDNQHIEALEKNFNEQIEVDKLNFKPKFGNKTVGEDEGINNYLRTRHTDEKGKNKFPTLLFFDPWGYKGINTIDLAKFMQDWGNEIFLFVNIKRIHAAIKNKKFDDLMNCLFPTTIDEIKQERRYKAKVHERLSLIMDKLASEFDKLIEGKLYHTSFKFQEEDSLATSHFIIHFTKHPRGYELVKQIFYDFDNIGASLEKEGTYTFDAKHMKYTSGFNFDFTQDNIEALTKHLLKKFEGRTISARKLFDIDQTNNKYCATHYVQTLRQMKDKDLINAYFNDNINHKVSVLLKDECILEFKDDYGELID